jgi:hypothetical protein
MKVGRGLPFIKIAPLPLKCGWIRQLKREKFQINKVGVFVNATQQEVMKMVDAWGPGCNSYVFVQPVKAFQTM